MIKFFFNLVRDIYIAFIYFSPENSSGSSKDIEENYSNLLRKIELYSQLGEIVLQGDFNAYTNVIPDFVTSDDSSLPN